MKKVFARTCFHYFLHAIIALLENVVPKFLSDKMTLYNNVFLIHLYLLEPSGIFKTYAFHLCYLCLVFAMLSRLFIAALWSPAWKGVTSWLLFVMFNCVFVTLPCGILGQVRYLIVSIADLFHISYFKVSVLTPPRVPADVIA